ncbi:ATP-dependent RNA helicase [Pseudomonas knackmussii B13]|uniref:ATP-dependent RNA helicase n=1 Tax=Pseudomonas knackmussii (strain DSM 6978 / CCUG 54928 / LMG 23759 / B13) TaxID=1301098 RepID=A0A024HLI6_PSEKB|nr:DEAD/DEAH box helicase [Pseudomonas knackmussii]CDF85392.1 ATP-dependent RNA helicase [Pseudomonas knackmussii B13]
MFAQFALHERLLKALDSLSFTEPTAVQAAAIPKALEGRDLRVTAQTGSGKTAAFLLPLLHRLLAEEKPKSGARALILLPTRELAQQTLKEVERFAQFTFIKACLITGGEDFKVQGARLRKNPEIIIGTPGRLNEQFNAGNLPLNDVEVLVLDEADRMLDMGFSEDVLKLAAQCPAQRQTLLFSATTGSGLREMIETVLREPEHLLLNQVSELNEEVSQQVVLVDEGEHKEAVLFWLLQNETYEKAIVFTNTRVQADRLTGRLIAAGHKVFVLHGEKDQKDRKLAIERLKQGAVKILVATDVAARGLDVDGLDLVINYDMPRKGDEYVHRIGRTGRAGAAGVAISLVAHTDWNLMSSIERYLKLRFEQRVIPGLKASYKGPKKVKASGKAAGTKKKKTDAGKKAGAKPAAKRKPAAKPKAPLASSDGMAPLKRKKPAAE